MPCVGVVHRRDSREIFVLQPEALVVLIAESAEQPRERIFLAFALALIPTRSPEEITAGRSIDSLHLLESNYRSKVVAPRLDLRRPCQDRDRSRGARSLVPAGRDTRKRRIGLQEESSQLALLRIELSGEVTDVRGLHFMRFDLRGRDRVGDDFAHDVDEVFAFARPVAGEVTLGAAKDINGRLFHLQALLNRCRARPHPGALLNHNLILFSINCATAASCTATNPLESPNRP